MSLVKPIYDVYKIRPGGEDVKRPYTNDWDVMEEFERRTIIDKTPWERFPEKQTIPDNIIYVLPVSGTENNVINLQNKYGVQLRDPKLYNMIKDDLCYDTNFKGWVETYKTGSFTTKNYKYFDNDITYDFSKLPTKRTIGRAIKESLGME